MTKPILTEKLQTVSQLVVVMVLIQFEMVGHLYRRINFSNEN